jgi:hypothetical protein
MAPEILQQVLSRYSPQKKVRERLTIRPAILHNYCRHRVLNADYPGMIEQQGASVRGTLVEGLTGMDVQKLDAFEGDEYERICVGVMVLEHANRTEGDGKELVEGDQVEADTYVFIGGEDLLEKKEWDYEEFRREKLSNWAATSEEYAGELFYSLLRENKGGRDWENANEGRCRCV